MSRRGFSYFNPDVVGAPAPPMQIAPSRAMTPARGKARAGLRRDLSFMRQVVGGMLGFAGTNTFNSILVDNVGLSPMISRVASGAVVYGAVWGWAYFSADSPAQKKITKDAVLLGVAINIAVYLLTEFVGKAKNAAGLSGYFPGMNPPTPENTNQQQEYTEEYATS